MYGSNNNYLFSNFKISNLQKIRLHRFMKQGFQFIPDKIPHHLKFVLFFCPLMRKIVKFQDGEALYHCEIYFKKFLGERYLIRAEKYIPFELDPNCAVELYKPKHVKGDK